MKCFVIVFCFKLLIIWFLFNEFNVIIFKVWVWFFVNSVELWVFGNKLIEDVSGLILFKLWLLGFILFLVIRCLIFLVMILFKEILIWFINFFFWLVFSIFLLFIVI